jgi:hypothetical protein
MSAWRIALSTLFVFVIFLCVIYIVFAKTPAPEAPTAPTAAQKRHVKLYEHDRMNHGYDYGRNSSTTLMVDSSGNLLRSWWSWF